VKCGVCGKSVTGERADCEVCGAAILPAPLLSEADIEQYRRTCAIRKVEWEQVLRLRVEVKMLASDLEGKKVELNRLAKCTESKKVEAEKLRQEAEASQARAYSKNAEAERLEREIKNKKAECANWEQKIKQAQQELSALRQRKEKESKRKPVVPAAPPKLVPLKLGFCSKCWTRRAPEDIFCGKCGNRLE
jgi:DNA repair exonuclease SbcCD ATPase subunit